MEELAPEFHTSEECACPSDEIHATWHMEYHMDAPLSHEHQGYEFRRCIICNHYFVIGRTYTGLDRNYCGALDEKHPAFAFGA